MKIGVLSDTHLQAGENLPKSLVDTFEDVDLIIHAGDWIRLNVLEQLEQLAKVTGVWGNMDGPDVRGRLPEQVKMELEGHQVGIIHGWGPPARLEERILGKFPQPPELIIYGHTHQPVFHQKEGTWFLNPGSPTDRHFAPRRTCALLTLGAGIHAEIIDIA